MKLLLNRLSLLVPLCKDSLNSKKCRFGIWLYNQNLKENSKSEAFKRIEELHIEIHNIIKVILNQEINPSEENIKIIIKDIINHRDKFLEEFEKLFF